MQFFLPALSLLLVAAKLFGAINWSWWLVFSPMIVAFGFAIVILAVYGFIAVCAYKYRGRKL